MNDRLAKRLFDAHRAAVKIQATTREMTFAEYESSELTRYAVGRLLEIVGEALSAALRQNPDLETCCPDFRRAMSLGNRIIHGYGDVNDLAIWDIARTNIPLLIRQLEALLGDEAGAG